MKKLLYAAALLVGLVGSRSVNAQQLAGTTWQGKVNVPKPTEVIYEFRQDTLVVRLADTKAVVETMLYKQEGYQYTCQKLSGASPCGTTETGIYKFAITSDQLTIMPIMDKCVARMKAATGEPLKRISRPTK